MSRQVRIFLTALIALVGAAGEMRAETHESFTEPFRKIDLAPAESGVLTEIGIREGDRVRAGQVLASLDKEVLIVTREIAAAAADALGRYESAVAEEKLREGRLKKFRELHARGHATQDELQRAEAETASAQGQRRSVEEQRQIDRLEVRKTDAMIERRLVRSPIDGVVTRVHREQGEYVTPMAPIVVTVTQLHPLRAVFNLPQSATAALRPEMTVMLSLEDSEQPIAAKVEMVSPIIDADSGTIRVKVTIDNREGKLHAGRRCFLTLDDSIGDKAASAPPASSPTHVSHAR